MDNNIKTASWTKNEHSGIVSCSECKEEAFYNDIHGWFYSKFCPWCGCEMKNSEFKENDANNMIVEPAVFIGRLLGGLFE